MASAREIRAADKVVIKEFIDEINKLEADKFEDSYNRDGLIDYINKLLAYLNAETADYSNPTPVNSEQNADLINAVEKYFLAMGQLKKLPQSADNTAEQAEVTTAHQRISTEFEAYFVGIRALQQEAETSAAALLGSGAGDLATSRSTVASTVVDMEDAPFSDDEEEFGDDLSLLSGGPLSSPLPSPRSLVGSGGDADADDIELRLAQLTAQNAGRNLSAGGAEVSAFAGPPSPFSSFQQAREVGFAGADADADAADAEGEYNVDVPPLPPYIGRGSGPSFNSPVDRSLRSEWDRDEYSDEDEDETEADYRRDQQPRKRASPTPVQPVPPRPTTGTIPYDGKRAAVLSLLGRKDLIKDPAKDENSVSGIQAAFQAELGNFDALNRLCEAVVEGQSVRDEYSETLTAGFNDSDLQDSYINTNADEGFSRAGSAIKGAFTYSGYTLPSEVSKKDLTKAQAHLSKKYHKLSRDMDKLAAKLQRANAGYKISDYERDLGVGSSTNSKLLRKYKGSLSRLPADAMAEPDARELRAKLLTLQKVRLGLEGLNALSSGGKDLGAIFRAVDAAFSDVDPKKLPPTTPQDYGVLFPTPPVREEVPVSQERRGHLYQQPQRGGGRPEHGAPRPQAQVAREGGRSGAPYNLAAAREAGRRAQTGGWRAVRDDNRREDELFGGMAQHSQVVVVPPAAGGSDRGGRQLIDVEERSGVAKERIGSRMQQPQGVVPPVASGRVQRGGGRDNLASEWSGSRVQQSQDVVHPVAGRRDQKGGGAYAELHRLGGDMQQPQAVVHPVASGRVQRGGAHEEYGQYNVQDDAAAPRRTARKSPLASRSRAPAGMSAASEVSRRGEGPSVPLAPADEGLQVDRSKRRASPAVVPTSVRGPDSRAASSTAAISRGMEVSAAPSVGGFQRPVGGGRARIPTAAQTPTPTARAVAQAGGGGALTQSRLSSHAAGLGASGVYDSSVSRAVPSRRDEDFRGGREQQTQAATGSQRQQPASRYDPTSAGMAAASGVVGQRGRGSATPYAEGATQMPPSVAHDSVQMWQPPAATSRAPTRRAVPRREVTGGGAQRRGGKEEPDPSKYSGNRRMGRR
jgi:hypothetical protein